MGRAVGATTTPDASLVEGGTPTMGPGALPVDSSSPPRSVRPPPASDETWADMVHDGVGNVHARGQREYVATPAVTRARAKRVGASPGLFALMATQEDITRSIATEPARGAETPELPQGPACDLETPETYAQAHTGPHDHIWTGAEQKELVGLVSVGTFEEAGGM